MTQIYTDFSEYASGVMPPDWTRRWNSTGSVTVEEVAGSVGGSVLRLVGASGSNNPRRAVSWDAFDSAANRQTAELLMKHRSVGSPLGDLALIGRGAGAASSETGAGGGRREFSGSGVARSIRYVSGTFTAVDSTAAPFAADVWYWSRVQLSGQDLRLRTWVDGDDEPATWSSESTIPAPLEAGWAGILFIFDDLRAREVDVFSAGTDGDPAPSTAPSTGFTLTTNAVGDGSITLDPPGGSYDENTVVQAAAAPATGWSFDSWSGDLTGTTNPDNVTMDADKSITANFSEDATPPATPANLNLTPSDGQVSAEWNPSAGATGHRVYTNTVENFGTATQVGSDLGASADSLLIESLNNGEQVWVYVTAFNSEGESSPASGSATPVAPPPPPPGRAKLVLQRRVAGEWVP